MRQPEYPLRLAASLPLGDPSIAFPIAPLYHQEV
jgi:hypothetical protein